MKPTLIILIGFMITAACRQKPIRVDPVKTTLEGKKIDVSSIYKKRSGDLVEALYDELLAGSTELTELELAIKDLKLQGQDSLKDYRLFNQRINSYYDFAVKKATSVSDSILKKKLQAMIKASQKQYADSSLQSKDLDSLVTRRTNTINDLHITLKLVKTLPLIEDWQRSNLPPARPAANALQNLDSLVLRIDSIIQRDSNSIFLNNEKLKIKNKK